MNQTRKGTADSRSHHGTNSFDAAVDAFSSAMKKISYPSVPIDASSIGWPSVGGERIVTTTFDVLAYNKILVRHLAVRKGTRKNLRRAIDAYLFTLSNSKRDLEDKPASWTIGLHLYTLFTADSCSHHGTNSFVAAVDAFYSAMKKIGYPSVLIDASSTGWPSADGEPIVTTTSNTIIYNQILVRHLAKKKGTRKNPRRPIDAYFFTLSNSKRDPEHNVPIDASSIIWPSAGGEPIVTTTFDVLAYNQILTRNGTTDSRSHDGTNSFDVAVDAFYSAMKKIGYPSVLIDASSTGWPSAGGEPIVTTTFNTLIYNHILVRHLAKRKGTRKNPRRPIDAYFFIMSNSKRDPEDKSASWTIGLHLYTPLLNFWLRMSHCS
ncbi:Glucan endo-1-3-beta-glucosidase [Nymphaea thermarum]|nr:Glucan endo-1-3-beta-glucosidase [Nymphaea thermarum]